MARDLDGSGPDAGGVPSPTWRADAGPDASGMDAGVGSLPDAGPSDAGASDGGAPDAGTTCVSGTAPWDAYTVSDADRSRAVEMTLEPDAPYRTLTVELEVEPGQWQPDCFNPASGRWMSPFQILLEVRKGARWCRGGNLFELAARGPDDDDLWVESYYADHVGGSCSGEQHEILTSHPASPLSLGVATPIRLHMDVGTRTVEVTVGSVVRTGSMDPALELVARTGEPLVLVTSLERYLECYAPDGGEGTECCHLPALGWTYRSLRYTACR